MYGVGQVNLINLIKYSLDFSIRCLNPITYNPLQESIVAYTKLILCFFECPTVHFPSNHIESPICVMLNISARNISLFVHTNYLMTGSCLRMNSYFFILFVVWRVNSLESEFSSGGSSVDCRLKI